jgi:hypothetical protein
LSGQPPICGTRERKLRHASRAGSGVDTCVEANQEVHPVQPKVDRGHAEAWRGDDVSAKDDPAKLQRSSVDAEYSQPW